MPGIYLSILLSATRYCAVKLRLIDLCLLADVYIKRVLNSIRQLNKELWYTTLGRVQNQLMGEHLQCRKKFLMSQRNSQLETEKTPLMHCVLFCKKTKYTCSTVSSSRDCNHSQQRAVGKPSWQRQLTFPKVTNGKSLINNYLSNNYVVLLARTVPHARGPPATSTPEKVFPNFPELPRGCSGKTQN